MIITNLRKLIFSTFSFSMIEDGLILAAAKVLKFIIYTLPLCQILYHEKCEWQRTIWSVISCVGFGWWQWHTSCHLHSSTQVLSRVSLQTRHNKNVMMVGGAGPFLVLKYCVKNAQQPLGAHHFLRGPLKTVAGSLNIVNTKFYFS